jgi:hypothetical protein
LILGIQKKGFTSADFAFEDFQRTVSHIITGYTNMSKFPQLLNRSENKTLYEKKKSRPIAIEIK